MMAHSCLWTWVSGISPGLKQTYPRQGVLRLQGEATLAAEWSVAASVSASQEPALRALPSGQGGPALAPRCPGTLERGLTARPGAGFLGCLGLNYNLSIISCIFYFTSTSLPFCKQNVTLVWDLSWDSGACGLSLPLFCRSGVPQTLCMPCRLLLLIKKHKQSTFWQTGDLTRYWSELGTKRDSPIPWHSMLGRGRGLLTCHLKAVERCFLGWGSPNRGEKILELFLCLRKHWGQCLWPWVLSG